MEFYHRILVSLRYSYRINILPEMDKVYLKLWYDIIISALKMMSHYYWKSTTDAIPSHKHARLSNALAWCTATTVTRIWCAFCIESHDQFNVIIMNHGLYTVINLTLIPQTLLLSAHTHIVDGRQPCVAHRCVSAFNAGAALGNLTDTGYALTHSPPPYTNMQKVKCCGHVSIVSTSSSSFEVLFSHYQLHL